ncbi:MAG: hypothetical protein QOJ65_1346 [Fimbriimonadaceae bacterium]|jgi:hypothetical protein|nr:hypothetical protein [Fimbriimonadaceae bacterium]
MKRAAAIAVLVAFAASALANGAMGLALEMFDYRTWAVYVVVTLVFEAWFIGRWLELSWGKSLGITVLANALTAFVCPICLVPVLHRSFVGTAVNPNPLMNSVVLLTLFGVVSGLIESFCWSPSAARERRWQIRGRSLLAHLIGVPIALAILLIPARPYKGLETTTNRYRMWERDMAIHKFAEQFSAGARFPASGSPDEFMTDVVGRAGIWTSTRDAWALGYVANFHRFDTSETRRIPFEINPLLLGKTAKEMPAHTWVMRAKDPATGRHYGYYMDNDGESVDIKRWTYPYGYRNW